ncbi:hypothetical protein PHYSODRAFT_303802 [Phytophthora sojae]|uniref:Uncharacterized protein n=1 Tax=Phytophthora sojae (strain P6497) TaxID=1094619 RepID=G4ZYC8_PHYSP|nr:hypothetical protein PHYSODRAFT_303802 [Phytophthora sojae]EGZ11980.1 hypothetical protein PHYSODRAFT_303802 [Phytophthora sojae]|eukprot:XP_009532313.1 hypothetical protein PHYSODRAFT_303802 [Phytophthora sojae]
MTVAFGCQHSETTTIILPEELSLTLRSSARSIDVQHPDEALPATPGALTHIRHATAETPPDGDADGYCFDARRDCGERQLLRHTEHCVRPLLFGTALMKLLRDYTRRKGYVEIQQDDRNMYSNVLMGTSDSWENVRVADPKQADDAAI